MGAQQPLKELAAALRRKFTGYFNYYGVIGNGESYLDAGNQILTGPGNSSQLVQHGTISLRLNSKLILGHTQTGNGETISPGMETCGCA